MLAVECPKICFVCQCAGGNQRVGDLDAVASSKLAQKDTRLMSRVLVNRNTSERPEQIVDGVVLIRVSAGPELGLRET